MTADMERALAHHERLRTLDSVKPLMKWRIIRVVAPWVYREARSRAFHEWHRAYIARDLDGEFEGLKRMKEMA